MITYYPEIRESISVDKGSLLLSNGVLRNGEGECFLFRGIA